LDDRVNCIVLHQRSGGQKERRDKLAEGVEKQKRFESCTGSSPKIIAQDKGSPQKKRSNIAQEREKGNEGEAGPYALMH
jgi:hypothetical protein